MKESISGYLANLRKGKKFLSLKEMAERKENVTTLTA